ncbi:MAG: efflux RND transporter periplasmic adaptor subunit [Pseudomonadota bacterium]
MIGQPMRSTISAVFLGLMASTALAQNDDAFDCVMDPFLVVELGAPVAGLLADVSAERGDVLQAGQVVAELESSVENTTIDLLTARANSDVAILAQEARRDLIKQQRERIATLVSRNVASEDQLQQVEAELVTAEAQVKQAILDKELATLELARARTQLAQRTIASPIAGVVQERLRSGGEYLATNAPIMTIAQLDPLQVEAFLPVEMYPELSVGMSASITPDAPFEGVFEAIVTSIDQIFDAASGTFTVRLRLPNPDTVLPAGHRCLLSFPNAG